MSRELDIRLPGIVLGIGMGGFVDGIGLHQVLQWHHMLSSTGSDNIGLQAYPVDTVPGLQMNTVWDGLFHTLTWLSVLIGLYLLYSRVVTARGKVWGSRVLWGWILVGWGVFNLVDASSTTTCWQSTTSAPVLISCGGTWGSWHLARC